MLPDGSLEAVEPHLVHRPATSWVHYTTSCKTPSSAPEDGRNHRPKHVELTGIINKPLLLQLVGCLYYCINDARSDKRQCTWVLFDPRNKYRLLPLVIVVVRDRGCVLKFLCTTDMNSVLKDIMKADTFCMANFVVWHKSANISVEPAACLFKIFPRRWK